MPYHVVPFTMAQVRKGALEFQRQLGASLHETKEVYSASPFDLEARRRIKDRFGGDVVYFLTMRLGKNASAWVSICNSWLRSPRTNCRAGALS